jgi:transposase-like protein
MNAHARHTTPVTDAERARIVALAAEGKTLSEISAAVGRDHSVVRRHLDAAGRQTTRRGYARVSCAEDRAARITSLSLAEPEPLAAHAADDDNDEDGDGDEGEGLVVAELALALPPATPPAPAVSLLALDARPTLRSECRHASRPCPWVSCEEHALLAAVSGPLGSELTDDQLTDLLAEMPYSCLADIVEERTLTLDEVAAVMGVTRERVRQLEEKGLTRLRFRAPRVGLTAEAVADILRPEQPA